MPVLNECETLYVHRGRDDTPAPPPFFYQPFSSAQTATPAQVLPCANTATVREALARWSVNTSRGAGRTICGDCDDYRECALQNAVASSCWRSIIALRDNLGVNDCIVSLEEQGVETHSAMVPLDSKISIMNVTCGGHSACLCQKPLMECPQLGKLPTWLVKLGHLLESGRTTVAYVNKIVHRIRDIFEHKEYTDDSRLPADFGRWRDEARRVLKHSRSAQDLTIEIEELLITADSYDWADTDKVQHWCKRGHCPLGCGSDRHKSLRIVTTLIVLSVGGPMAVALLYR